MEKGRVYAIEDVRPGLALLISSASVWTLTALAFGLSPVLSGTPIKELWSLLLAVLGLGTFLGVLLLTAPAFALFGAARWFGRVNRMPSVVVGNSLFMAATVMITAGVLFGGILVAFDMAPEE